MRRSACEPCVDRQQARKTNCGGAASNPITVFRGWRSGRTLFRADIEAEYERLFDAPHLTVHRDELLRTFGRWNATLTAPLARAESCFKWGLFDHAPLGQWSKGRITLLGDAAHPMLPFMGQGAAMALENGLALGLLLSQRRRTTEETLRLYERMRLPRTARVQWGSRARAAENHLRSPLARRVRNAEFKLRQLSNPHGRLF